MAGSDLRGQKVVHERYEIIKRLDARIDEEAPSSTWLALNSQDDPFIVKAWPYVTGSEPDDVQRALWDAELRTMYRVGSSPGAEETLTTLREAALDAAAGGFVMVLAAPGPGTLADLIANRTQHSELADQSPRGRREIWAAMSTIAHGIRMLHEQHVLHRNVRAETIFVDPDLGLASARLGGFEWSVRLGRPATAAAPATWSTPPERLGTEPAFRLEHDWFGLGIVAARCLLDIENYRANAPADRYIRTLQAVQEQGRLSELERALLVRLLAEDPMSRLTRAHDVIDLIGVIMRALETDFGSETDAPLVIAFEASNRLVDAAREVGYVPASEDPLQPYNPNDLTHVARLRAFLRDDVRDGQIHAVPRKPFRLIVGQRLVLRLTPFRRYDRNTGEQTETWKAAYCSVPDSLRATEQAPGTATDVPGSRLAFYDARDLRRNWSITQEAEDWERILPRVDRSALLRADVARFHEFLRCTNQIELLMRDSELFAFHVVSRERNAGFDEIIIEQTERERPPASFADRSRMWQFLEAERETGKQRCDLVLLSETYEQGLSLPRVEEAEHWLITGVDTDSGRVTLSRAVGGFAVAPDVGILRTHGMFGQVSLVRRRKKAIDRLATHAYLLRSLSEPGQVYMDTGPVGQVVTLPADVVDEPKRAAIEDILRVRPIYSLQGPPGTGKTTLVAWLVRQILDDDPVAQILVTAQAHGAVDVLKDKVATDAFHDVPEGSRPLEVRLRSTSDEIGADGLARIEDDSVEGVALSTLRRSIAGIDALEQPTTLQQEWHSAARDMIDQLRTQGTGATAPDFTELVKRGAHLIYCTTSAGELESLAEMTMSFDWSILEEAGKAHGFDLALPLQAGHRWLLIGDQYQLPPYRFKEFYAAVEALDAAAASLRELPDRGAGLVDYEWLDNFRDRSQEERESFIAYAKRWLRTFACVFDACESAPTGQPMLTTRDVRGAAAGRLTGQHRMHPTIGSLISETFYRDALVNRTVGADGAPRADVQHPFDGPGNIAGRAIVWLDLPPAAAGGPNESGPLNGRPRYTNRAEAKALATFLTALRRAPGREESVDLAVLSPYNRQVALLRQLLPDVLPIGVVRKQARRRRRTEDEIAYSVDSFQGNQAKIIAVSLVRNNTLPAQNALGFLEDKERMNVLLSRAEALLVLVGSFDFFALQVEHVALDEPAHALWHLRKATDLLARWFEDGRAIRLPAQGWSP